MEQIPLRALILRALPTAPLAIVALWLGVSQESWIAYGALAVSTALFVGSLLSRTRPIDRISRLKEVSRSLAVIEFTPNGDILHANDTFLDLMGYSLDEVRGRHHRMFVSESERNSPEYAAFWRTLQSGEFQQSEFCRVARDGSLRWITASYNPIFSSTGKLDKVIKFATDVTGQHSLVEDNLLVRFTLDSTSSCVLLADEEHRVTYSNIAMQSLLQRLQADFQSVLPGFRADGIEGVPLSGIHPELSPHAILQATVGAPLMLEQSIGARLVRIVAMPVVNVSNNKRVGTIVKMFDRTAEVATERELQGVVERANSGELDARIALEGKTGALRSLSEGVNQLLDASQSVIEETMRVFGAMAQGDLSQKIEGDYDGAFAQLKADANATVDRLVDVTESIRSAIDPVREGAKEIADGNLNLSTRTDHQATSLETTAANLGALTETVKRNAESAQDASDLARTAREEAENGGRVARNAVTAMSEINASSQKIADIVGVIDEIAFQTNLLALNAAVEAARAGEQGRGFAVVASEVRNLAGRSASSAKEIKDLIEDSERKVAQGSRLVNDSGDSLDRIVERVHSVSSIVGEIAGASREQSEGIHDVNTAISRMDEMTQQNSAMVQQAAAASKAVGAQADKLARLIEFFEGGEPSSVPEQNTYRGPERRAAARPWSGPPAHSALADNG